MTALNLKRVLLSIILLLCIASDVAAQNLLNLDGWTIGSQVNPGIFSINGAEIENLREWGQGPQGNRVIVWKASPSGSADADGGWNTAAFAIDHTKMYRFTVWIKKTNSLDGLTFFGCHYVNNLTNVPNGNPYFFGGKLPALDKWYLLVGYIHGSGDVSTTSEGGMYDGVTGAKVQDFPDFKFATDAYISDHRAYLFYDPNINDRQYFYSPRVDIINGNEPSIQTLLGVQGSGNSNGYFAGKVGIQTTNPGDYELAVNGKVRAKEVRVEAGWSDFVFDKDYSLLPLKDVEGFISKNKHLPDIPSQKEVDAEGVELGKINSRLLQKIEELTLYIIQMNKKMNQLEKNIKPINKNNK